MEKCGNCGFERLLDQGKMGHFQDHAFPNLTLLAVFVVPHRTAPTPRSAIVERGLSGNL